MTLGRGVMETASRVYGSRVARVGIVQVQGWRTAILPLTPSLMALSPAFSGSLHAGSDAADSQALESLTTTSLARNCRFWFARSGTCLRQTDNSPTLCTPASCIPLFPTNQLVYQSTVTSRVGECLAPLANGELIPFSVWSAKHTTVVDAFRIIYLNTLLPSFLRST
jgi:hypothetical protein